MTTEHPLAKWNTPEIEDRNQRILQRPPSLKISGMHKSFGHDGNMVKVLNDIDFTAYKREFVCVVGPSGAVNRPWHV
ncbi:hypothetical protein THIOSC15_2640015 [uncultured Thiomicrorhabdus sp.]